MKKNWRLLIKLFLLLVVIFNIGATIWQNKNKYFTFDYWQRYPDLKFVYENSQYVSKQPIGWIPDEVVLSYAGGAVIKGTNPILVLADTPPLGKYLIGLSALVSKNENIIILILGLVALGFLYLIGRQIYSNKIFALLPLVFLSFEPLFENQFVYVPLLDIIQLAFLLPSFYFFNQGLRGGGRGQFLNFSLASIFLGAFISTKFFITGLTIISSWYLVILINRHKKAIMSLTLTLTFALFVLMTSYLKVFLDGEGLRRFFGIQKWIFLYHKSQLILPFSIWPLILFNKWYVWFGDRPIISDPQWRITWPIVLVVSLVTIIFYFLRKIPEKREFEVLGIWVILYILFFSFGQISARYLVIYLPVLYLVTFFGLEKLFINIKRRYGH